MINHGRFLTYALTGQTTFPGYDQTGWVAANGYRQRSPAEVIATWATQLEHLIRLLENYPAEALARVLTDHPFDRMAMRAVAPGEALPFGFIVEDFAMHFCHHLRQIDPELDLEWYMGYRRATNHFRAGRNN